jgi:hypothetical protein
LYFFPDKKLSVTSQGLNIAIKQFPEGISDYNVYKKVARLFRHRYLYQIWTFKWKTCPMLRRDLVYTAVAAVTRLGGWREKAIKISDRLSQVVYRSIKLNMKYLSENNILHSHLCSMTYSIVSITDTLIASTYAAFISTLYQAINKVLLVFKFSITWIHLLIFPTY